MVALGADVFDTQACTTILHNFLINWKKSIDSNKYD